MAGIGGNIEIKRVKNIISMNSVRNIFVGGVIICKEVEQLIEVKTNGRVRNLSPRQIRACG